MISALLLHVLLTGALALLFCGLVTAQWLLARLSPQPSTSASAQPGRLDVPAAAP